jgi:HK97 family phage portal protein
MEIPFALDEILHFKRPHPNNDFYGLGDMEAGSDILKEVVNRSSWSEKFWKNGAAPSGLMILDDVVDDQENWDRARAKWQKEYGGRDNAGKIAWVNGKWRYEQMGLSLSDMQDLERSKYSDERIFLLHGVPLSVAGLRDAANFATAEIADQQFRQYTVAPVLKIIEGTQQTDLVQGYGNIEVKFNLSGLLNVGELSADWTPLFDRGVISINEMREKVGLNRIEDNPLFDQHFINAGLVPLDLSGIADLNKTDQQAQRTIDRFTRKLLEPVNSEG